MTIKGSDAFPQLVVCAWLGHAASLHRRGDRSGRVSAHHFATVRLPGTSSATSAATAEGRRADPDRRHQPVDERLGRGVARRRPVKTVASTATPSTPPTSRIVFVAPEACPASLARTEPSTAFAAGANTSAMPAPAITNPGITLA